MRQILVISIILFCSQADAQVFKRTGPDGKVYFSDRPGPDAEQVEVAPLQTIHLPPVRQSADAGNDGAAGDGKATKQQPVAYSEFLILSPIQDQAVRANNGNVNVQLALQPALQPGHLIKFTLDGEDGVSIKSGSNTSIELRNLSRGRHDIEARIEDADGNLLIQAGPVGFNVLRVAAGG